MFMAQMKSFRDESNLGNMLLLVNGASPAEASAEALLSHASEAR